MPETKKPKEGEESSLARGRGVVPGRGVAPEEPHDFEILDNQSRVTIASRTKCVTKPK